MALRSAVKRVFERVAIWSGAAMVGRRMLSNQVLVLAYHNVVPDDAPLVGDLANHLPLSSFRAQLDALQRTHDIVPLADTLAQPRNRSGKPRVAITFDDAYRGAVIHAVGELVQRSLPATIFVAPAFIGGRSFWWDALAGSGTSGLDSALRAKALGELRGEDEVIRAWASRAGFVANEIGAVACAATEEELFRAAALPGITLGSHTWAHPNLARLEENELSAELSRPLSWLRARCSNVIPWIAYPYGCYDDTTIRAAAAAGYTAGLGISGGFFSPPPENAYAVPRVNIPPGLSVNGLMLRGAGLLSG